jgi:23S rRNA (uracil1939-C5)-methyltransferase/tRNA (uracil-5-)-methyltransferase
MMIPRNFTPHPYTYRQELEIDITDVTNEGNGVGRHDGWVIMVPFVLVGERVKVRVWRNKKNYSDADLVEVISASPNRTQPRCSLFASCGGCQYQHMTYEAQKVAKQKQIADVLRRIGGFEAEIQPVIGSPEIYNYRSKITPHWDRKGKEHPEALGFLRWNSRAVLDIAQCPIATVPVNEALAELRKTFFTRNFGKSKAGTVLLRQANEGVITNMNQIVTETVNGITYRFQSGEFFQNNAYALPGLVDFTIKAAVGSDVRYLLDAYCGVGLFALQAARSFEKVIGVEINSRAIDCARENAVLNGIENVQFLAAKSEAIFADIPFPRDETALILDPPRAGCDTIFLDQLIAFKPRRCVYVSCGPDTQARDLKYLCSQGYVIEAVQPFDLFPHTRHVENVVVLVRQDDI